MPEATAGSRHTRAVYAGVCIVLALAVLAMVAGSITGTATVITRIHQLNIDLLPLVSPVYLWFANGALAGLVILALSPLGKLRLGGADAHAIYGRWSWLAMLFAAGMGTGLLFWGTAEPLFHMMNPPEAGLTVDTRMRLAFEYSFFHWGLHPWAIYACTAIAVGYVGFNRQGRLSFSGFLDSVGARAHTGRRWGAVLIDILTILAIVIGLCATFGMGVLQLQDGAQHLFGFGSPWGWRLGLIAGLGSLYLLSAESGIRRGIRYLSNLSLWGSLLILGVLWLSATFWRPALWQGWQGFATTLGSFAADFIPMSLGQGAFDDPGWVQGWTVKYWSWWIAWAPFVGLFIAHISRGRTLREMVLGVLLIPTAFSIVWFWVLGQTAIGYQLANGFAGEALNLAAVPHILFAVMDLAAGGRWLAWLCWGLIALYFINSADSAIYTLAELPRRRDEQCAISDEPDSSNQQASKSPVISRLFWAVLIAGLTLLVLALGEIELLQEITLLGALPFTVWLVVLFAWVLVQMTATHRRHGAGAAHQASHEAPGAGFEPA